MGIFPECVPVYHVQVWGPKRPEESFKFLGSGVVDGCELLY